MRVTGQIKELREVLGRSGKPVVLVPTMGALHAGHLKLVDEARERAGAEGVVVVSIFVNPTQFAEGEDFGAYPRDLEADVRGCEAHGADLVFAPAADEMYAGDASVVVDERELSVGLCGGSRPGHFAGVCSVVLKLFNIVRPEVAVFGKKDFQQLAVIRRLVRDLDLEIDVVGVETVREADGLAMSSRNRYLSGEERQQAAWVRRALLACRDEGADFREVLEREAPLGRIDYVEEVDLGGVRVMAVAVYFGKARLIDNIELDGGREHA
ncbi:MAG: pantoate--beta-alanine ligase [Verrucomicrobiales bacterium]|nr:pantoate--beta-alanine ligase [Verrucomicrobiales bacterium]